MANISEKDLGNLRSIFMCTVWKHHPKMVGILDRYFHSREIYTFGDLADSGVESAFKGTKARKPEVELFYSSLASFGLGPKSHHLS